MENENGNGVSELFPRKLREGYRVERSVLELNGELHNVVGIVVTNKVEIAGWRGEGPDFDRWRAARAAELADVYASEGLPSVALIEEWGDGIGYVDFTDGGFRVVLFVEEDLEAFNARWTELEAEGACDARGGGEYERVREEWLAADRPPDVDHFIRSRARVRPLAS